jgi:ferric-dicitrate binding protein FerR (iron transport regulator)
MDESREKLDELGRLAALTALAREAASAPVSDEVHAAGRHALIAAAAARPRALRRSVLKPLALAALALAAVAGALVIYLRPTPLAYEIRGGSGFASNYLSAPPAASAQVRFSDGSSIEATPSTRLRVEETASNGARVLLERGETHVHVVHRQGAHWLFVAGPFEVTVTGTRFTLAWDPTAEQISVTMQEGSVEVDSPVGGSHFALRAGQRFRASLLDGTTKMDGVEAAPASAPPAGASKPEFGALPSAHPAEAGHAAPEGSATRESWSALVRQGAFAAVVAAARSRGVDACFASCSGPDLRALADAARYTGQADLAQRSLLSLRERFPHTGNSAAAGFLLGRIAESNGQVAGAEGWYAGYLSEAPNGEFAADALAGRMRATAASKGKPAAKPLAAEYLRRYPDGVHARAARAIAGSD